MFEHTRKLRERRLLTDTAVELKKDKNKLLLERKKKSTSPRRRIWPFGGSDDGQQNDQTSTIEALSRRLAVDHELEAELHRLSDLESREEAAEVSRGGLKKEKILESKKRAVVVDRGEIEMLTQLVIEEYNAKRQQDGVKEHNSKEENETTIKGTSALIVHPADSHVSSTIKRERNKPLKQEHGRPLQ